MFYLEFNIINYSFRKLFEKNERNFLNVNLLFNPMVLEYNKRHLIQMLSNRNPEGLKGYIKRTLGSFDPLYDCQDFMTAKEVIPIQLQADVWNIPYSMIKYAVDSNESNFGIIISPVLFERRPNDKEIELDSKEFGLSQAKNGPNRICEVIYKFIGYKNLKEDLSLDKIRESLNSIDYVGPTNMISTLPTGISFINSKKQLERIVIDSNDTSLRKSQLRGNIGMKNEEYGFYYGPDTFESVQSYLRF